jgi:hypothetical protein
MAFAHDLDGGRTDLVILAAQDFGGEPLATIATKSRDDTEKPENSNFASRPEAFRTTPAPRFSTRM